MNFIIIIIIVFIYIDLMRKRCQLINVDVDEAVAYTTYFELGEPV